MAINADPNVNAQMLTAALSAPVPRVYVNGFLLAQSLSDIMFVANTNGTISSVLNMSFTTAKSLSIELAKIIKTFEEQMGHTILTIENIQEKTTISVEGRNDNA